MKIRKALWYDKEDVQAIEELRKKEDREDFSDMARLVIKDGIKARSKKK